MRRHLLLLAFLLLAATSLQAQQVRDEIRQNPCLSGSNYLAYPTPNGHLNPAPDGKQPFYISHYGRHGSRYLISESDYTRVYSPLCEADSLGLLTPLGKDVKQRISLMMQESHNRWGELTPLGARQHREIAHRMFERFPEVFQGSVHVDAKSTNVIRCILSMENALQELVRMNPRLEITHDASMHDMWYIKSKNPELRKLQYVEPAKSFRSNWERDNLQPEHLLSSLFTDSQWVSDRIDKIEFYHNIFELANIIQNSEIRHTVSLYDLFSEEELYTLWQNYNIGWFIEFGPCTLNGATQPTSQRPLLGKIISEADSCVQLEHPGATLRFGHDTNVLPLVCLMDINGYGRSMSPDQLLEHNWVNYRIFPMACNLQFVFYRRDINDRDIWVKVLLNEEEATLPLTPVSRGFYKWSDIKEHYGKVE